MSHAVHIVDVFASGRYEGNPLAVVVCNEVLAPATMQAIAAETNYSETTFITPVCAPDGGFPVRMFTPAREIAFAGHPILGSAWVLRHCVAEPPHAVIRLNLAVGQIPVEFDDSHGPGELAWFRAPEVTLGARCEREAMAAALGLEADDIDDRLPIRCAAAGTAAMMVPLRSLDALRRSRLDLVRYSELSARGFPPLVYLFCRETRVAGNDLSARFFFEANGLREDPATGNGAAFLGAYLLAHDAPAGTGVTLRIEQGHEIGRPSLVHLQAGSVGGIETIRVGGQVIPTIRGVLV